MTHIAEMVVGIKSIVLDGRRKKTIFERAGSRLEGPRSLDR
jgi:hypothetical protein